MRFRKFHLKAVGPFTQATLDFEAAPGLTLIYGPNESGKSSALRAIRAFLFGFKERTTQNFLHPSKQLCVGAEIEHDRNRSEFFRYKKRKNSLLDGEGQVVSESVLSELMGGLSEQAYQTLYGLDHQTLVSGGEALLSGGGDLSESLFSAGLGPHFHALRQSLQDQANSLWTGKSKKKPVDVALRTWKEARALLTEESLSAGEWRRFCQELESTEAEGDRLKKKSDELDIEIRRLERLQRAAPRVARRAELLDSLSDLGEVITLADDFPQRRRVLESEHQVARSKVSVLEEEVALLKSELEALGPRSRLLPHRESISALQSRVPVVLQAKGELPQIRSRLDAHTESSHQLRQQLGLEPDFQASLEDRTIRRKARVLVSEEARLRERCLKDVKALELSDLGLQQIREELDSIVVAENLSFQVALLAKFRDSAGLDASVEEQAQRAAELMTLLGRKLDELPAWTGGPQELRELAVPSLETVGEYRESLKNREDVLAGLQGQIEQVESQLRDLKRKTEGLFEGKEALSLDDLQGSRQMRDESWSELAQAWSEGSVWLDVQDDAQSYLTQVAETDRMTDRLLSDGERLARLQVYHQQARTLSFELEDRRKELHQSEQALRETKQSWESLWRAAGGVQVGQPLQMLEWLKERQEILELSRRVEREKDVLNRLSAERLSLLSEAKKALLEPRLENPTLRDVISALESDVDRDQSLVQKRQELKERESQASHRINELTVEQVASQKALAEWKLSWTHCLKQLVLSPSTEVQELEVLLSLRDDLQEIESKLAADERRLEQNQDLLQSFEDEARSVAEYLGQPVCMERLITQAEEWFAQLRGALDTEQMRTQLGSREETLNEKLADSKLLVEEKGQALAQLLAEAGVKEVGLLSEAEKRSADAKAWRRALSQLETELRDESGGATVAEFCKKVREADFDSLENKLEELRFARDDLRSESEANTLHRGQLEARKANMDGTQRGAQAAQLASQSLAEGKALLEDYLKLRLAEHILTREMNAYRDTHQGGILRSAGAYFQKLSCGNYHGLTTDYDSKGEPNLVALSREGRKVEIPGLSDGTRDQLYLSLRLATIERGLGDTTAVPIVLDDVLVHFDSPRAKASLEVLQEFSKGTQTILFSHLERDRDLAREMGDGVQIIELEKLTL